MRPSIPWRLRLEGTGVAAYNVPVWKRLRRRTRWIYHPVTVFLGVQVIWVVLMVVWIGWYIDKHAEVDSLAERVRAQAAVEGLGWLPLIVGGILLALILAGVTVIFVYWSKQHRLNRMQQNFVANVTHELKSPVASIQLAVETMALRELSDTERQEFLGMVLADTDRLTRLIDRILGAARIERLRNRYAFEQVSMRRFIEEVLESDRHLFEKDGHKVVLERGKDALVSIDRPSMHIVLSNLIENAARYSPRGSAIQLRLHRDLRNCRLDVVDSGSGIERKDLKNIFKMFWRAEHSQSARTRGTGLGLYIVRSIVRDHRGSVWATSAGRERGSVLSVRLPRFRQPWRAGSIAALSAQGKGKATPAPTR